MMLGSSLRGIWSDYGPSAACAENFLSAACWFGQKGSQAVGLEHPSGTITVTPPPVSSCAGVLNADGSCSVLAQPNDPNNTTEALNSSDENFIDEWNAWVERTRSSANVPQDNTAGTGPLWMLGLAAVGITAVVLLSKR